MLVIVLSVSVATSDVLTSDLKEHQEMIRSNIGANGNTTSTGEKNVANTKKRQSRNALNINITQMMVGKQLVKR